MTDTSRHPVWEVYDELRTAKLNVMYYSHLLMRAERWAKGIDVFLALTAPGSAISALWLWSTPKGRVAWAVIGFAVAVVASIKPFLGLPERIKKFEKLVTGYRGLEFDLHALSRLIRRDGQYGEGHVSLFNVAIERRRELVHLEPMNPQNDALVRKLEARIGDTLPPSSFYVPESGRENERGQS